MVLAGGEVVIANRGRPMVRLVATEEASPGAGEQGSSPAILARQKAHPVPEHAQHSAEENRRRYRSRAKILGLIYLDACLLIYLVERRSRWGAPITRLVEEAGGAYFAIAALVKCECSVGPLKGGNLTLRAAYLITFDGIVSLEMPDQVYLAELRTNFGLRDPDALHLACAQHYHCDEL